MKAKTFFARMVAIIMVTTIWLLPGVHAQTPTPLPRSPWAGDVSWNAEGVLAVAGSFSVGFYSPSFELTERFFALDTLTGTGTASSVHVIEWHPIGPLFVTAHGLSSGGQIFKVWGSTRKDLWTESLPKSLPTPVNILSFSWRLSSRDIAIVTDRGVYIHTFETFDNPVLLNSPMTYPVRDASYSPDGVYMAAVSGGDSTGTGNHVFLDVWDATTKELLPGYPLDLTETASYSSIERIAWQPGEVSTAVALGVGSSAEGAIVLLDIASQEITPAFGGASGEFNFLAWSPDGSKMAGADFGAGGSSLYVWDSETREQIAVTHLPTGAVFLDGAWNPGGTQLAMVVRAETGGSAQSNVYIYDAATGEEITMLDLPG